MMPPFDSVVRSPLSGVEIRAHTPSLTFSRFPNGSRATTRPYGERVHAARAAAGMSVPASARCAAQLPVLARNSLRLMDIMVLFTRHGPRCGLVENRKNVDERRALRHRGYAANERHETVN